MLKAKRLWLKISFAATVISILAACGENASVANETRIVSNTPVAKSVAAKQLQDHEAIIYAKVALSTFPQLPLDIAGLTSMANSQTVSTGEGNLLGTSSGFKVLSLKEQHEDHLLETCEAGGFFNIEREPSRVQTSADQHIEDTTTHLQFMDCVTGNSENSHKQNGDIALNTSHQVSHLNQNIGDDALASFKDYSHTKTSLATQQSHWLDGEFGLSVVTNNEAAETTTLLAATGTIANTHDQPNSIIYFDRFGVVFETSPNQELLYMYGQIKATLDDQIYSYTLSTIAPMGKVDDNLQGQFLIEVGASRILISRNSTNDLIIELDNDSDGSIDYATTLPVKDINWPLPPAY